MNLLAISVTRRRLLATVNNDYLKGLRHAAFTQTALEDCSFPNSNLRTGSQGTPYHPQLCVPSAFRNDLDKFGTICPTFMLILAGKWHLRRQRKSPYLKGSPERAKIRDPYDK